jgi:hypothetical protein
MDKDTKGDSNYIRSAIERREAKAASSEDSGDDDNIRSLLTCPSSSSSPMLVRQAKW